MNGYIKIPEGPIDLEKCLSAELLHTPFDSSLELFSTQTIDLQEEFAKRELIFKSIDYIQKQRVPGELILYFRTEEYGFSGLLVRATCYKEPLPDEKAKDIAMKINWAVNTEPHKVMIEKVKMILEEVS